MLLDDDRPVDGENKPAVAGAVARRGFFFVGKKASYFLEVVLFLKW